MSILKKAIAVLNAVDEEQDFLPDNAAYVHALQSKGLLAPDLPEPDVVKLNGDVKYFVGTGKQVRHDKGSTTVQIMVDSPPTISEARELAYALLAACKHAEKEQK